MMLELLTLKCEKLQQENVALRQENERLQKAINAYSEQAMSVKTQYDETKRELQAVRSDLQVLGEAISETSLVDYIDMPGSDSTDDAY